MLTSVLLLTLKLSTHEKNRRKILSGSRKIFFAILAMFLSLSASAQQITASGQVLDAQKEPLIGVSVQEKGTSNGAITDLDGNFTLNVKQNAILIFSYVGYKSQEVKGSPTDEDHTSGR